VLGANPCRFLVFPIKTLKKEITMTEFMPSGETPTKKQLNPYLLPGTIVFSALFISLSILYAGGTARPSTASLAEAVSPTTLTAEQQQASLENIRPVSKDDHIKGNITAPVKIVEFSDSECPFCKAFHPTLQQIVQEYDGQVAWVYRHFPLDQIHSKARREAAAIELAGELGGNEKFWQYLDRVFEITPANDGLDLNLLPQIAQDLGLPRQPFEDLVAADEVRGGKFAEHIEADFQDAVVSGGRGTPYSIVIAPNGKKTVVSGAQSYEAVKAAVEAALQEK